MESAPIVFETGENVRNAAAIDSCGAMDNNLESHHPQHKHIPSVTVSAVLGESASLPAGSIECKGHDFSASWDIDSIMKSFVTTGFQATNIGLAIEQIREMRQWRLSDVPWKEGDDEALKDECLRKSIRARIFLAYTSNQISCGQREVIRYLVQNKMVDVLVSTAGGIEEDLIKCFQPTYMGDFKLSGEALRKKGINRIGNLLIPNSNYCEFEDWVSPIINAMHDEQDAADLIWAQQVIKNTSESGLKPMDASLPEKFLWTPSSIIRRLGTEINHPDSVLYWAAVNDIPIFCPALTDGSFGDMLYFHSYKRSGFVLDVAKDIRGINDLAVRSHCTGQIILGGGLVKHHTCNANLMRNGADYSVYVNTACEYDGSDSGASPDEAISWGKIRATSKPVKVTADATIAFPLIVAATFAKDVDQWKKSVLETICWIDE
jgi:deoxyhypusine synthase